MSSAVPRPSLSLLRRHTGLDWTQTFYPGRVGGEQPGLPRTPLPETQTLLFGGRLRRPAGRTRWAHPAFPPPRPAGREPRRRPLPRWLPLPSRGRSGQRPRLGKGKPAAPRREGEPVVAAAHRVAALPAAAAG